MTEVAEPLKESEETSTPLPPADEPLMVPNWLWALVGVMAIVAGALTVGNGFIHTDHTLIAENSMLWNGYGLQLIWTSIFPSPAAYQFDYYAPVSWSLLSFEWRLFRGWAGGYHIVSLLLHAAASLMIVQMLRKLALPGAGLVGLLFAAHPVLLGATGWLSMQPMVLGTLFSLASLYVTLRWMGLTKQTINALPPEANRLYMLMIVTVVIASLAHPIAGLVPVAALLISWWKRGTVESQQMSSLAPIALLGIAVMGLYLYMQSKILSSATLAELDFGTTPLAELFSRLQLAGYSLVFHALKLIVPYPLNFDYGRPPIGILMLASLVIVAGGVGLLFSQSQKIGRGALAALGLYALFLLPFLNIFNIERMRWSFIRDGEVYAAAIPLLALLVVLLIRALKSEKTALPIIGLVALVFAGLSLVRSGEFKDDATLWQKTIARNPNSLLAELETTKALIAKKDPAFKEHLNRALTINKKNLDAQTLEAVYAPGEYLNQSIAMLSKLVNTYPTYAPATFATAQQLEAGAELYKEVNRMKDYGAAMGQAFDFYTDTAKNDPRHIPARIKVGQLLIAASLDTPDKKSALDKSQQAIIVLQQAVDMNPNRIESRMAFAKSLYDLGMARPAEREAIFSRASENLLVVDSFDPGNAEAAYYAGLMHLHSGFNEQSLLAFKRAHEKRAEWVAPILGIARVYLKQEEFDKAREWLDKARAIEPDNLVLKQLDNEVVTAATRPSNLVPATLPTTNESTP